MRKYEYTQIKKELSELSKKLEEIPNALSITEEVLLDSSDMLKLLKCSNSTLHRLRKKRAIPFNKIGGRYYYPKYYFTREFLKSIIEKE